MSEFPADWTPEQCAKYRELMESKRKPKIVSIPPLDLDPIRTGEPRLRVEKPTINLDELDLDEPAEPKTDAVESDDEKPSDPLWMVRIALKHIKPTGDSANRVGRALHSAGEKGAFDLWCQWMVEDRESAKERWERFASEPPSNSPITVETIYWLADEAGWRRPLVFKASRLD